jgi:hypothetical protein
MAFRRFGSDGGERSDNSGIGARRLTLQHLRSPLPPRAAPRGCRPAATVRSRRSFLSRQAGASYAPLAGLCFWLPDRVVADLAGGDLDGNFTTGPIDRIPLIIHKSSANGAQSKTFRTLTAFRPQCLGSIGFPNWAGAVHAIELQKF